MKIRNYEKKDFILWIGGILVVLEVGMILFLFQKKEFCYQKITSILVKDDLVLLMVDKKERSLLYQNKILFYHHQSFPYKIVEDRGVILKKDDINYYELLLEVKTSKEKKVNDSLEFSIRKKKERLIEIMGRVIK